MKDFICYACKSDNHDECFGKMECDCTHNKFHLTPDEAKALVKEFSSTYINTNDNHLASVVMQRMIGFVNELAKDNT